MKKTSIVSRLAGVLYLCVALVVAGGSAADAYHMPGGGLGVAGLEFVKTFLLGGSIAGSGHYAVGALQVEIWENHIEGNIFKDNEFIMCSVDAGDYVLAGKVVHIPQAGSVANVEEDRTVIPATVTERGDSDVTYALRVYTTDPIRIPFAEQSELSYDKRESVLSEYEAALNEKVADRMLINWAPTASTSIIRTTGAAVATHLTGTTGNRLAFSPKDLKRAMTKLNKQNIVKVDRYCLMSDDMYDQFTDALTEKQQSDFSRAYDEKTGVVGYLHGFKIMTRSSIVVYNSDATAVNALDAANAATDNDCVLCWQKNSVERAKGQVKFFSQIDAPAEYGDVYSFLVRAGGRKRRDDQKGIIAIVQDAA